MASGHRAAAACAGSRGAGARPSSHRSGAGRRRPSAAAAESRRRPASASGASSVGQEARGRRSQPKPGGPTHGPPPGRRPPRRGAEPEGRRRRCRRRGPPCRSCRTSGTARSFSDARAAIDELVAHRRDQRGAGGVDRRHQLPAARAAAAATAPATASWRAGRACGSQPRRARLTPTARRSKRSRNSPAPARTGPLAVSTVAGDGTRDRRRCPRRRRRRAHGARGRRPATSSATGTPCTRPPTATPPWPGSPPTGPTSSCSTSCCPAPTASPSSGGSAPRATSP